MLPDTSVPVGNLEDLDEEKRALLQEPPKIYQLLCLIPKRQPRQRAVRVVEEVSHQWDSLARSLRFRKYVIQIIAANHPKDCEAACCDMFGRWLQGRHNTRQPVTWETLIRSVYETDTSFKALGDKLVKALCEVPSREPVHVGHPLEVPVEDQPNVPDHNGVVP